MIRKIFVILALLIGLVSGAWAGEMSVGMYYVFNKTINLSNHNLVQKYPGQINSSFQNLRNTCGTMSALAIHNYYNYKMYGEIDDFTRSKKTIENAIVDIFHTTYGYDSMRVFQKGADIKNLAMYRWGWGIAKIRSSSSPIYYDYNKMIEWDLKKGRPIIVLLKSYSPMNNHRIQHFVVIVYATNKVVAYFDPWDGNMKTASKQDFLYSWVNTNYAVVIDPR